MTKLLAAAKEVGLQLLVTATYRSIAEQNDLYALGRTKPGAKVTNAVGGTSFHNCRRAADLVILSGGKPVWTDSDPRWLQLGKLAAACDLEWGGLWKFKDFPHVQYRWCEGHKTVHEKAQFFNEDGTCRV